MKSSFTFIDLFAGIGGMRLGFEAAGGRCVLTCEIDQHALETYKLNFKKSDSEHVYVNDIFDLESSVVKKLKPDVLVAGFPCQPYSIAGLRKGLGDKRGQVFGEIIRLLRDAKPEAFLLENVKGMVSHDKGRTYREIMKPMLEKSGYIIKEEVLNTMTHGNVPQNRERLFIVGFRSSHKIGDFSFPKPIKLLKSIDNCLWPETVKSHHYYDERFGCYSLIKKEVKTSSTLYQWRRQYVRENKSNVCPTLTANMGSGGHNVPIYYDGKKIRKLTPFECAMFQGFPRNFKLPESMAESKLYHQFGNSVTVPLIYRIAQEIKKVL
jgi:DNA (cytosine-5)-methyltransferase 1